MSDKKRTRGRPKLDRNVETEQEDYCHPHVNKDSHIKSKKVSHEPSSPKPPMMDPSDPLRIGTIHWVYYKENVPCKAEIIETRQRAGGASQREFYVHYINYDKRLDTWISKDRFLNAEAIKKAEEKVGDGMSSDPSKTSIGTRRRPERSHSISNLILHGGGSGAFSSGGLSEKGSNNNQLVLDPAYEQLEREHEEATKVKNIQKIELGRYEIDCWYFSPYPDEYAREVDLMYICEHCLKYMKHRATYVRHFSTCSLAAGPPGKLIYLKDQLAVFESDGAVAKLYCQNLCLLAKLFLDHKTLYYDVSPFVFYVLCEVGDEAGRVHPVGYFSKEKASADGYNLACIMILPPYQKRGYGRFLIQLSYEITRREGRTGSPEKPLSDLGRLSYRSFWAYELLTRLKSYGRTIPSISDICMQTGFMREDVHETLSELGLLTSYRGQLVLNLAPRLIEMHLREMFAGKKFTLLDPEFLNWP